MVEEDTKLIKNENGATFFDTGSIFVNRMMKIFLLLVIFVVIITFVLFIMVKDYTKAPTDGRSKQQHVFSVKVCTTPTCLQTSTFISNKMNLSVDPCEDMYQYACGGWIHEVLHSPKKGHSNLLTEFGANKNMIIINLIKSEGNTFKGVNSSAVAKLKMYYRTCMDEKTIKKQGIAPILKLINELGSWSVTSQGLVQWDRTKWTLQESLLKVHLLTGSSLFSLLISIDAKNSSRYIMKVTQSGLTLLNKDEYTSAKFRDAFLTFAVKVGLLLGGNHTIVTEKMSDVFELEKRIAEITVKKEDYMDPIKSYNKMTLGDFQKLLGHWVDIGQYIRDNFNGKTFSDKEEILVETPSYFDKLGKVIETTDKEVMSNYIMWNLLTSLTRYFPDEFSKAALAVSKVEIGKTSLPGRSTRCLALTEDVLGFVSSALFLWNIRSSDNIAELMNRVKRVLEEIKREFTINLEMVPWLDKVTRQRLKDKANSMTTKVGYPDWILDPVKLDQRYEQLQVTDGEFLSNKLQAVKYFVRRYIDEYDKPPDLNEWTEYPDIVNAFYSMKENCIMVPAGTIYALLNGKSFPESFLYGSLGMLVGHELIHGFDNNGRKFDQHGQLADMWTHEAEEAFHRKSKCIEDQYSAYKIHGEHLNGVLTLGENIADNGGLKFAFKAYKTAHKKSNVVLPDIELTDDQLFFVGFSQIWCARSKPEKDHTHILTNKHSINTFRVFGCLSNSKEFATAFNCAQNSLMNPKDKCVVW